MQHRIISDDVFDDIEPFDPLLIAQLRRWYGTAETAGDIEREIKRELRKEIRHAIEIVIGLQPDEIIIDL
jgi:hypothetical protein